MNERVRQLIEEIRREAEDTVGYTGRAAFGERVMRALAEVPRERFVPHGLRTAAYYNGPLPIGHGQTISQPYIVALMTDLLDLTPESVVLEIGTGSGYQAAILAALAKQVYSIEYVPELAEQSRDILQTLGYSNVEVRCDNGYRGWAEKGPFDAIIVTAAAPHVPPALIEQLKPGGHMAIPVGLPYMHQELLLITKAQDGTTQTRDILPVAFVPLVVGDTDPQPDDGPEEDAMPGRGSKPSSAP